MELHSLDDGARLDVARLHGNIHTEPSLCIVDADTGLHGNIQTESSLGSCVGHTWFWMGYTSRLSTRGSLQSGRPIASIRDWSCYPGMCPLHSCLAGMQ